MLISLKLRRFSDKSLSRNVFCFQFKFLLDNKIIILSRKKKISDNFFSDFNSFFFDKKRQSFTFSSGVNVENFF
jgi:hypothetical protein